MCAARPVTVLGESEHGNAAKESGRGRHRGTFTDFVVMTRDGVLHESKVSTTPSDPSLAVVSGLEARS
jgi:hypothetical protein